MKTFHILLSVVALLAILDVRQAFASDEVLLQFKPGISQGEVGLHANMRLPVSSMYSEYTLLGSSNLVTWQPVGSPIAGGIGVSDEVLRQAVTNVGPHRFYKVVANVKLAPSDARVGGSVFGYGTEFSKELQRLGQLPLDQFVQLYTPTNSYLPQISFDPTTAEFWDQFNLDPAVHNATNSTEPRLTDFRLNTNEFLVFQTNGFVVSPRLGSYSFADLFYKVYVDDLPVFFSCDAALQAWHRSYTAMLEELEETYLSPTLEQMIQAMRVQALPYCQYIDFPFLHPELGPMGPMTNGIIDADYFLAVAETLVRGSNSPPYCAENNVRLSQALTAISNLQPASITVFGANRLVDFSQFRVRGHYDTSPRLQNYFRASMWCNLIDFRFTGATNDNSLRELSGVAAMGILMNDSGQFTNWQKMDRIIEMFVGLPDSMNFAQLTDVLAAAEIHSMTNLATDAALRDFHSRIMSGDLGVQNIRSGYFFSPLSRDQLKLPRSFTVMGQRFILDGWAHSQCTYDSIIWDDDGIPDFNDKVKRRVPSALDVAFSVFANDNVTANIAGRISKTNGVPWRDGLRYQHNLAAVRNVIDAQDASAWTNNVYSSWLGCLRELSKPTTGPEYPQTMRTRGWAMKTVNTQLASWTELRHDTVLYAKQPYTAGTICSYPHGYVEPRPAFWARMRQMAQRTRDLMTTLPDTGQFVFESTNYPGNFTNSMWTIYTNRLQHLDNFASIMTTLETISQKELNHEPLATNETVFLQNVMEIQVTYAGQKTYNGWYPTLFYRNARSGLTWNVAHPSDLWDALVTDVHTDVPDFVSGDPGCVLHEGVGNVHLLMVAIDSGPGDTCVYAGPVLSHYEFQLGPATRRTDSEWKADLRTNNIPPPPDWTTNYLVPGSYSVPSGM